MNGLQTVAWANMVPKCLLRLAVSSYCLDSSVVRVCAFHLAEVLAVRVSWGCFLHRHVQHHFPHPRRGMKKLSSDVVMVVVSLVVDCDELNKSAE